MRKLAGLGNALGHEQRSGSAKMPADDHRGRGLTRGKECSIHSTNLPAHHCTCGAGVHYLCHRAEPAPEHPDAPTFFGSRKPNPTSPHLDNPSTGAYVGASLRRTWLRHDTLRTAPRLDRATGRPPICRRIRWRGRRGRRISGIPRPLAGHATLLHPNRSPPMGGGTSRGLRSSHQVDDQALDASVNAPPRQQANTKLTRLSAIGHKCPVSKFTASCA